MGIVRDLYYARKMSAGLKLPAPTVALLIKRLRFAAAMGGGVTKTVSGTMVHITDALAKAALSVLASIEPTQDLHGYSSPWPAGGGKNKWEFASGYSGNGNLATNIAFTNQIAAGTYVISCKGTFVSGGAMQFRFVYTDSTTKDVTLGYNKSGNTYYASVIFDSDVRAVSFIYSNNAGNSVTDIQLESGSTFSDYSPYSNICPISGRTGLSVYVGPTQDQQDATTHAVDWTTEAGTVYGGTLDVVTGVLTVTRKTLIADGTQTITSASSNRFFITVSDAKVVNVSNQTTYAGIVCDRLPSKTWASLINAGIGCSPVWGQGVAFKNPDITTAADWNTYFTNNPTQFSYELATPLTYQLTAQEVQMLLGENNVWSSSGDTVSVTYYAEGNANPLQSLNILLGGRYSNPKTADDVSDKEALEIILGGNK